MKPKSIFRSAITGADNEVDAGYLALFASMVMTVCVIPPVVASGVVLAFAHPDKSGEILQQTMIGCGTLAGAFSTIIGAVGLFRVGDKPRANTMTASTTTQVQTGG